MIKNIQKQKKGKSWLVNVLKSQMAKVQNFISTWNASASNLPYLCVFYWMGTLIAYPLFFGTFEMVSVGNELLAIYYLTCALIPLLLTILLLASLIIDHRKPCIYEKGFTVLMLILFIDNVAFSVLSYENLYMPILERFDDIIVGYPLGFIDFCLAFCAVKSIK
jgi:hypothetical protein